MSARNEPREDVAAMLRDGATYDRIKLELGVSSHTITATRKHFKIGYAATGPGRRITPEQRPIIERRVCELARAGATYQQTEDEVGVTAPIIAAIRRKYGLPMPGRNPPRTYTARSVAETWALYAQADDDGHVQWNGPFSGRMPLLNAKGSRHNARRVAFRTHHGRDPVGYVLNTCPVIACIAGAHLTDKTIRDQLETTHQAIFGQAS